jgi:hypothetical protein
MPGDRFHLGAGVPCAVYEDIKVCHCRLPRFRNQTLIGIARAVDGRIRPPTSPIYARGCGIKRQR